MKTSTMQTIRSVAINECGEIQPGERGLLWRRALGVLSVDAGDEQICKEIEAKTRAYYELQKELVPSGPDRSI